MRTIGIIVTVIFAVILLAVLSFALTGADWAMLKFWAPKYEQVRRETFEQSKAYRQGQIQDLSALYYDYLKGSDSQKETICALVRHRYADIDKSGLPLDLRNFLDTAQTK